MKVYNILFSFLASLAFAAASSNGTVEAADISSSSTSILRRRLQEDGELSSSEAPSPAMMLGDGGGMMNSATPQPTGSDFLGGGGSGEAPPTVEFPTDGEGSPPTFDEADGLDEAPVSAPSVFGGDETPVPFPDAGGEGEMAPSAGFDGETPVPFPDGDGTPTIEFDENSPTGGFDEPTPTEGFDEPTPTVGFDEETPSYPVEDLSYTESPFEPTGSYTPPVSEPTFPSYYETSAPVARPESEYIPNDDDPLQPLNPGIPDESWAWNDSTVDDVEHDRTVLLALSVTFAVGVCLAILTAQQMLENPHGCCARYVRDNCHLLSICDFMSWDRHLF